MRRWTLRLLLVLVLLPAVLLVGGFIWLQTEAGRGMLRNLAESRVPGLRVDAISGTIPFDMRVDGLALADADGVWLSADTARLAWAPMALLGRTLRVEAVEAGRLEVLRPPLPSAEPAPPEEETGPFALPELPVDVVLERLAVDALVLGEALIGERAEAAVAASGRFGRPADGVAIDLDIRRIDASPGTIRADAAYRPETGMIAVDMAIEEPAGGMIARLAGLPGAPAVTLDLAGDGTLDDFAAELAFDAGPALSAAATLALTAEADGRRLVLDGRAVPDAFLDGAALRALTEGGVDLDATVDLPADGPILLDEIAVAGAFGRLVARGQVDPAAERLGVDLAFEAGAAETFAGLTGGAGWRTLGLDVRLDGPFLTPMVTLAAAAAGIDAAGVAADALAVEAELVPDGPLDTPDAAAAVTASAELTGFDPRAPALAALLEEAPLTLDLAARVGLDGDLAVEELVVALPVGRLTGDAVATGWGAAGSGALAVTVPRLDAFAGLAGLALEGAAELVAEAGWGEDGAAVDLVLSSAELATGIAAADGLVGGEPVLTARLASRPDGALTFEDLSLMASGTTVNARGGLTGAGAVDAAVTARVPDLARIDPALTGAAVLDLAVRGPLADPAATAELTLSDAVLAGTAVASARLTADTDTLVTAPQAQVALQGAVAGLPADLSARLALDPDGRLAVDDLALSLASLSAEGGLLADGATATLDGRLVGRIGRLADLAGLTGQPLTGGLEFDVTLAAEGARQDATLAATLAGAGLADQVTVGFAEVSATLSDLTGVPGVDAAVTARSVSAGGTALDRLSVTAAGDLAALDVTVAAAGTAAERPASLDAAARIGLAGEAVTVALGRLAAQAAGLRADLAAPATLTAAAGDVTVDGLALAIGDGSRTGRLTVDGRYGVAPDLRVTLDALPLGLADAVVPELGLEGVIDAQARWAGTRQAPEAALDVAVTGASAAAIRQAGLPPADHRATVRWQGGRLSAEAQLGGLADDTVDLAFAAAAPADPASGLPVVAGGAAIEGRLDGRVELARFNALLAGGGTSVAGALTAALTVAGTLDQPALAGRAEIDGGRLANPLAGIALSDIALTLEGQGRALTLTRFTARTPDGGTLGGSGALTVDPPAGFPGEFELAFDEALVIASDIASVTMSGTIGVAGPLARTPTVVGRLVIPEAEIRIAETLPPSVPELEVEEVNLPPELAARRPPQRETAEAGDDAAFVAALDITVDAPQRVFVRGRGLDAEVGGRVVVAGSSAAPQITGAFTLRRGILDALGRRFDFEEGAVTLPADGSLNPELRFVARTDLEDAVAQIVITGRADDPEIAFQSVPELPTDEIFARILFEKPTGSLTPFEAVQLAQQVAALTGVGGGGADVVGTVREAVGLDRLDVEAGDEDLEGTTVNAGRYIADGVFLGVEQGLGADSSRVTVEIEITDNITVESDVGADNSGRVGVNMQWDY